MLTDFSLKGFSLWIYSLLFCIYLFILICRMYFYLSHITLQEWWFGQWHEPHFRFSKVCTLHSSLKYIHQFYCIEFVINEMILWSFPRLLAVNIHFKVKAINLQTVRHQELPDCYDFNINVSVRFQEIHFSISLTFKESWFLI